MMLRSAVALVAQVPKSGQAKWLGTCFALRHKTRLLTAQHVVKGRPLEALGVAFVPGPTFSVTAVHLHPTADIAILETTPDERRLYGIVPFAGILTGIHFGEDFGAFGFPEELFTGGSGGSPHRLIIGY